MPPKTKKVLTSKSKSKKSNPELSGFFSLMLEKLGESQISYTGAPIYSPTICNICHILPKRIYKSVATDERNIIFLTISEHARFDSLLDRMEFDQIEIEFKRVWKICLVRIIDMYDSGDISECGKLLNNIFDKYGNEH